MCIYSGFTNKEGPLFSCLRILYIKEVNIMETAIKIIDMRIDKLQKEYDEIYKVKNSNSIEMQINIERLRCHSKAIIELKIVKNMILQNNE